MGIFDNCFSSSKKKHRAPSSHREQASNPSVGTSKADRSQHGSAHTAVENSVLGHGPNKHTSSFQEDASIASRRSGRTGPSSMNAETPASNAVRGVGVRSADCLKQALPDAFDLEKYEQQLALYTDKRGSRGVPARNKSSSIEREAAAASGRKKSPEPNVFPTSAELDKYEAQLAHLADKRQASRSASLRRTGEASYLNSSSPWSQPRYSKAGEGPTPPPPSGLQTGAAGSATPVSLQPTLHVGALYSAGKCGPGRVSEGDKVPYKHPSPADLRSKKADFLNQSPLGRAAILEAQKKRAGPNTSALAPGGRLSADNAEDRSYDLAEVSRKLRLAASEYHGLDAGPSFQQPARSFESNGTYVIAGDARGAAGLQALNTPGAALLPVEEHVHSSQLSILGMG